MDETEGFEACHNTEMGHWYILHRQMKGGVLHRTILAENYESEEEANSAIAIMQIRT